METKWKLPRGFFFGKKIFIYNFDNQKTFFFPNTEKKVDKNIYTTLLP